MFEIAYIAVATVSVVAAFFLAEMCGGLVDDLLRYGNLDLIRSFGGVV